MLDIQDYIAKIRKYRIVDMFRYDDISVGRIFVNIARLITLQALGKRFVEAPVNNYRMILDLKTPGLSKALFVYRSREILDTRVIHNELQPDMNFLEVGANIGYYALLEATNLSTGTVIALEPDPRNVELLKKNIQLNNVEDKVKVYPYAASDENTTLPLHLNERTNVSNFVHNEGAVDTVDVTCVRLDTLPEIKEVDFIRMDIEGYECKVLRGLENIIYDTKKPLKIMIEVHLGKYNDTDLNFSEELHKLFDASFVTKYLISAGEGKSVYESRGYKSVDRATETGGTRYLYRDVSTEDTLEILTERGIRSILLERK